jgi:hypothetical protein
MNKNKNDLSDKAEAAFRATATMVIERAKQTRTPVVIWEDGHVKEIPSDQFEQESEPHSVKKSVS